MNSRKIKSSPSKRGRLPLHVYLVYLLVCTFLLTGVSFSRYISTSTAGDSARAAKGLVTVSYDEGSTKVELSNDVIAKDFSFSVSNGDSEVAIRYDLVIELDEALPDGVTMKLDGDVCSGTAGNTYHFSNVGKFEAGVPETNTHTLSFIGDFAVYNTDGSVTYPVTISVLSEQID